MKKILVTGITGFAGSHLADFILEAEQEAHLFGMRRINSGQRNVRHLLDRVTWIEGDLTDPFGMDRAIKESRPDEVYHLGALSWVAPSFEMPAAYMNVNAGGTINLLEAVRRNGLDPLILVSCSAEEFGDVPPEKLPLTEQSELRPVNHYAASKVAEEAVCTSYHAACGLRIIRTRAFNHEGPRRDVKGALASFAYQIARVEMGLQDPVIMVGNLKARRTFTHVRDMVRAYWLAMRSCTPGEVYLIGSSNIFTIGECLEKLISLSSATDIRYEVDPARVRPSEPYHLIGDFSKFSKATDWRPKIPFEKLLRDILDYWRDYLREGMY